MLLAEPMTVATDGALAALAVLLGVRLLRERSAASPRLVATGFLVLAAAAFVGGSVHGFAPRLAVAEKALLWRFVYGGVGLSNLLILAGVLLSLVPARWGSLVMTVLAFRFAVLLTLAPGRDFSFVLQDLALTLLLLLGLGLFFTLVRRRAFGPFLLLGALASFAGALVQARRLAPHPFFNHNDLFHVFAMGGLFLFYRAARVLPGASEGA